MLKPIEKVPIFPLLSQASDPFCWFHDLLCTVALTTQLAVAQEALSKEKTAWSVVDRSLAEEKTTHHATEQALQNSNDAKAELTQELESTKASLTATHDKLTSKSAALDVAVIQEQQAKIQMKMAEEKLKAAEEKLKIQEQSLDSARQTLSKWELSSLMMISSAVANAAALFKNYLPDLDVEILCKDFTINNTEREALANSAYDVAHDFVSLYDFSSLIESNDNNSPKTL
jgi:DNA repair exonuclease SbcCD ATPase subunit